MNSSELHFSEVHVKEVAEQIRVASMRYDKLFSDLGSQIFVDIVDLNDASEIMAVCRSHTENAIRFFETHFPHKSTIACQKGCCHCCFFPVTCPPQVTTDIASYLKEEFSVVELNELKKEMEQYIAALKPNQPRLKCPFLNSENSCRIYERRPLSCRSFTSSDSAQCKASLLDNRNITQDPIKHRIFQAATTALMAAAKRNDLPDFQEDFIPALLEALCSD